MENRSRNLKQSIVEYILHEASSKAYSDDNLESLEVARQCLETAWDIEAVKESDNLLKLFGTSEKVCERREVNEEEKKAAEVLKTQGNICMGDDLYEDAVNCYTNAINIDSFNAVYFCNRAAAYSKLNKNEQAIADCQHALTIDDKYSKAYSRMGLAYTAMNKFDDAIKCYKHALAIEPDNQNFKQNLQAAEEKRSNTNVGSTNNVAGAVPGFQSLLNNIDIGSLLNNPAMMNMAQQFMSQPDMRNMMSQMMHTMSPNHPDADTVQHQDNESHNNDSNAPNPSVDDFLTFGQQFAQQMQSSNPDLVNSLRQQYQNSLDPDNNKNPEPQI